MRTALRSRLQRLDLRCTRLGRASTYTRTCTRQHTRERSVIPASGIDDTRSGYHVFEAGIACSRQYPKRVSRYLPTKKGAGKYESVSQEMPPFSCAEHGQARTTHALAFYHCSARADAKHTAHTPAPPPSLYACTPSDIPCCRIQPDTILCLLLV